ncbi:MAG: sugar phosphate isomerase/epimerase [Anaerolineae bacterium]|nr:sugar phosphate isomerase/epimerase [Anaerolineae bacterium]
MPYDLAVSTWSFHRHMGPIYGTELDEQGQHRFIPRHRFPEDISLLSFAAFVRERYGLEHVELCQMHFQSSEKDYLDELRGRVAEAGSTIVNVPIDVGNISDRDENRRRHDLENIKRWMDVAAYIGSPCARVNSGQQPKGEESLDLAIASYRELAAYAGRLGLTLLLENHGGLSADPHNIVRMVEGVGSEHFRLCPDFGNFPEGIRYRALEMMFPYARMVHAKTFEFDGDGHEVRYDLDRCLQIAARSGYTGPLSIEFEGEGDQFDGVEKSVALLRRY